MNLTELARILKITPQELRDKLPQMGFDIGQRAIKVDNRTAQRIIEEWPRLKRQLEEEEARKKAESETDSLETVEKKKVAVPSYLTVKELASTLGLPINKILAELMKSGIFISLNEKIDFDTASIVGSDLGFEIIEGVDTDESAQKEDKIANVLGKDKNLLERAPVIVVMGHVDHGKTKLLDAIRSANVVAGEAGGITQHIGAYQVERKDAKITFIDTPGHEAFTAMRSRGAKIADIAVLVVAADDGVMPQTVEAFQIIKSAGLPFVVAINKVDKAEADINRVKQELSTKLNITPEDWGGKIICVPVSALKGQGIDDLLDMLILTAEVEAEKIKANPEGEVAGTIIESNINKGEGPVATVLIQNGTLKIGDKINLEGQLIGKVRALKNWKSENIAAAGPAVPARIIGLKLAPAVGDVITVGEGEKIKFRQTTKTNQVHSQNQSQNEDDSNIKKINLIIKSDVLGSAEAIEESVEKINTAEVKVKIIQKGLGNLTEGDVNNAQASNAKLIGFNVKEQPQVADLAREKNVEIKHYNIIYHLLEDLKKEMEALLEPETKRTDLGRLKVLAIFKTDKNSQVIGGKVISGKAEAEALVEIERKKQIIGKGKIASLQSGKENVSNVEEDQECGIEYLGDPIIEKDDILNFYKEEKIKKIL